MKKLILGLLLGLILMDLTGCDGVKTIPVTELGEELKSIEPMDIHWVDDKEREYFWKNPSINVMEKRKYPLIVISDYEVCAEPEYDTKKALLSAIFLPTDILALSKGIPGSGANFGIVSETICKPGTPTKTILRFRVGRKIQKGKDNNFDMECATPDKKLLEDSDCYKLTKAFLKKWNPQYKNQRFTTEE